MSMAQVRAICQGKLRFWYDAPCHLVAEYKEDDGTLLCQHCHMERLYFSLSPADLERISILGGLEKHG